ncbi:hypothetical protein ACWGJP_09625 [Microbacterium sp. NPDC055903]
MERTIVLMASAPLPVGHLVEVTEQVGRDAANTVVAIADLETGVHYQRAEEPSGRVSIWQGRVLATTITATADGPRTAVRIDPTRVGAAEAKAALRGADAAAGAAKAEADRWGGSDRPPYEEPVRIW